MLARTVAPPIAATPRGTVSPVAAARIREQERQLDAAGFSLPPPLYAPGTRVLELGDDNFHLFRTKVEALPCFADVAEGLSDVVTRERRRDRRLALRDVRMNEDGSIHAPGGNLGIERTPFRDLLDRVEVGSGAAYLADHCAPELRAYNVNAQLRAHPDRNVVLRTRIVNERRSIAAVVSPAYTVYDANRALALLAPQLADAHTELVYGRTVTATALWMPDQVEDLAAGDIFKVGVRIRADDNGSGSIRISGVVWRNLCLNLIVIGTGEVETAAVAHRGAVDRIEAELQRGVWNAQESVRGFLDAWGHARTVKVDAPAVLRSWIEGGRLARNAFRSVAQVDRLIATLLAAFEEEPGDTLADAVNAVTRAAHQTQTWSMTFREQLEREASMLVLAGG